MRRPLSFLIAMVMATLGWVVAAPTAAGATHEQLPVTYTYDAPAYDGPVAGAVSERGPPAPRDRGTTYGTVDLRSHGTLACPEGRATSSTTTYACAAGPAQAALATPTTGRHVCAGRRGSVFVSVVRGRRKGCECGDRRLKADHDAHC